jgi:hypothetical protein
MKEGKSGSFRHKLLWLPKGYRIKMSGNLLVWLKVDEDRCRTAWLLACPNCCWVTERVAYRCAHTIPWCQWFQLSSQRDCPTSQIRPFFRLGSTTSRLALIWQIPTWVCIEPDTDGLSSAKQIWMSGIEIDFSKLTNNEYRLWAASRVKLLVSHNIKETAYQLKKRR